MADIFKFSIVTYERKPGCWRAAITPKVGSGGVGGKKVRSIGRRMTIRPRLTLGLQPKS